MQTTERRIVLDAMRKRPKDPWPRGAGHVLLGVPGSPVGQKAYHEPGGGFSPSAGSFGVSIWVRDRRGRIIATSDDMALEQVRQRYAWRDASPVPSIETTTPHYRCRWSLEPGDLWQCDITPTLPAGASIAVLVRSVGPAGAPIHALERDRGRLLVEHRWVVSLHPGDLGVYLADERARGWRTARNGATACGSADGWACARIELAPRGDFRLAIRDTVPGFRSPLPCAAAKSALELRLPDETFAASLDAQAANLLMGFVGRQTCPGDPTNYPLAWLRDGAYSIVAMARCGQLAAARELAVHFAENDFFGGFGSEADAPGAAIHALVTVAMICGDAGLHEWLWPHVKRKVGIIEEMLSARRVIRKPWVGPIVPRHAGEDDLGVICQPARDGLIVGRMDHHYPVLYVNAFAYRGLRQAVQLAQSIGRQGEVKRLPAMAESIRRAWLGSFDEPLLANERTFMSALWPTWIADPTFGALRQGLQGRWERVHDCGRYGKRPLWTYFTIAEAHQWLFLERPEIPWQTLRYFWANQCSPGLYTFWEGEGEENSFGLWEGIRGWVCPPHVTPHYWTAAEMLLLQLDMLAYVSEAQADPVLVVGAGVPADWLDQPIHVQGLQTIVGPVDWSWQGRNLEVTLHGQTRCKVKPGLAFGEAARVTVRRR